MLRPHLFHRALVPLSRLPSLPCAAVPPPRSRPLTSEATSEATTSEAESHASPPPPPPPPQPSPHQSAASKPAEKPLAFFVNRTAADNVPVYQIAKRGGNKKLTLVRHIDGSRDALAARLAHALGLPRKEVKINPVTGHVVVAGHRRNDIVAFLEGLGF